MLGGEAGDDGGEATGPVAAGLGSSFRGGFGGGFRGDWGRLRRRRGGRFGRESGSRGDRILGAGDLGERRADGHGLALGHEDGGQRAGER